MSPIPPEFISADVLANLHRRAQHQWLARLTVFLAAFCTALLPAAASHASSATYKDLFGNRLYVANLSSNNVSVIDTNTNTVVGSPIPVGANPAGVATDTLRSRAYVANHGSGTVSVINTNTNTIVGSIAVGINPDGVATDALRGRAYVANHGSGTVSVINTNTNTVVGSPIPVGNFPFGVAREKSLQTANH